MEEVAGKSRTPPKGAERMEIRQLPGRNTGLSSRMPLRASGLASDKSCGVTLDDASKRWQLPVIA